VSDEPDVLLSNLAFYAAFAERDFDAMAELWATEAEVACLHPGWPLLEGRDDVLASWARILGNPGSPAVRCADARARVRDGFAWVTCREIIDDAHLVATNLFVFERGTWRLVHHQSGPLPGRPDPAAPVDDTWN